MLTTSRVISACMLTTSRVISACMLTTSRVISACMLTTSRVISACMLTTSRVQRNSFRIKCGIAIKPSNYALDVVITVCSPHGDR